MSAPSRLFPLGATAAAGTVTYFSCVRPMRRNKGCSMDGAAAQGTSQKARAAGSVSRMSIPTNRTPDAALASETCLRIGASCRHGSHQDPQTFRTSPDVQNQH